MIFAKFKGRPEIFLSKQGEGKNVGRPSLFLRLSNCNLKCVWCDTAYTWDWERYDKKEEQIEVALAELLKEISKYRCKNIVITGGEPLLQQKELVALMQQLKPRGTFFEVETNMTLKPTSDLDRLIDQYNCSPKLANSGNSKAAREISKLYPFFSKHPKATFKFVVAREGDLEEILELVDRYQIPNEKIYLMPEGCSAKELDSKIKWLLSFAKQYHFNLSDRWHIREFGNQRGV